MMRLVTAFLAISLSMLVSACKTESDKTNQNDVMGRYRNEYEIGASQYVDLKENGIFEHHYIKYEQRLTNIGEWTLDSIGREVYFNRWINYGTLNKDSTCVNEGCYQSVLLKDGELLFVYDAPEFNFIKED